MKEYYLRSLQMIKVLKVKNKDEYKMLMKSYLLLSIDSLKYISQTRNFKQIIKLSKGA